MKCAHCHKEIVLEYKMKLLNVDGDFVCDDTCYAAYQVVIISLMRYYPVMKSFLSG